MNEWRTADNRNALGRALAEDVSKALRGRRSPLLVVSGGATPAPFFNELNPLLTANTMVTLTDERWVASDHADSNGLLVQRHLPAARFLPLKMEGALQDCLPRLERQFSALPTFEAVILGMGEDGHTASLFPHHPTLKKGLAADGPACMAITDSPKPPPERITLTFARIIKTRRLYLHITGTAKRSLLEQVMQSGSTEQYPICAFLQQTDVPPVIYWAP